NTSAHLCGSSSRQGQAQAGEKITRCPTGSRNAAEGNAPHRTWFDQRSRTCRAEAGKAQDEAGGGALPPRGVAERVESGCLYRGVCQYRRDRLSVVCRNEECVSAPLVVASRQLRKSYSHDGVPRHARPSTARCRPAAPVVMQAKG